MRKQSSPTLDRLLLRLALLRMFLPLVTLSVMAICTIGYFSMQTLESRQHQRAQFVARMVDRYLDQATRALDAVGRVAEVTPSDNLAFMQGTWEAHGYFDTIYYLDSGSKIRQLVPPNPRYLGLDMSNLPSFKQMQEQQDFIISRPFISLHTGNPTVYLVRHLSRGGQVVGELNLGSLQDEITRGKGAQDQGLVFLLDQFGMLLAHSSFDLVRQQTNQGDLEIFHRGLAGDATLVYEYAGKMVLGSAARVQRAGWVVVDQVQLLAAFHPYAWALGLTLLASLGIWLVLTWNLRRQLQRHVVFPLVQFSRGIGALANGDFNRGRKLASIPATFAELKALATDFQHMSDVLKTRQAALQESEERYRLIAENTADTISIFDLNLKPLYTSPAVQKLRGYTVQEAMAQSLDQVLTPASLQKAKQVFGGHLALEESGKADPARTVMIELEQYCKDGSTIWVELSASALRDNDLKPTGILTVSRDITERKQAETSIRKLSQAIEQSPVSIIITDLKGRIEFVNTQFTEITGYTSAEVMGQNPRIFKSGETPTEAYRRLWEIIASGGVWQGEFHNRKKNGHLFWERATIAPVRSVDNVITHYVGVKEDITERKRLEEQLRQSQKMEAIGKLAGGVAHDFNNMLGVIIGYADLALDKVADNDSLRANIEAIREAGLRSTDITRQLLAFARKQTIRPKILDLNKTVEGMQKLLKRLIGEDINLAWLPGSNLWPVKVDPSQIDQILANLCVNAKDAINIGGKITIETQKVVLDEAYCADHEGATPGEYVLLAVSDNGGGMDKATQDKIFEPFFTTKGLGKGTGLGLATVYGIVKQNEGFIYVESEPGCGSTFKIYLPRHAVKTEHLSEESSVVLPSSGYETILIVEDERDVLELVKLMLAKSGYTVFAASTPREAIRIARENSGDIDLLITDLIMPEMTGRDLVKKLTALYPGLKYLFMSGYTGNVIAHQSVLDEDVNFIQKPFLTQELAAKVRGVLDGVPSE